PLALRILEITAHPVAACRRSEDAFALRQRWPRLSIPYRGGLTMRRSVRSLLVFALLTAVLSVAASSSAQDQPKVEEGFTSLFNGKDFTGWRYTSTPKDSLEGKTETSDGRMMVKDGIIVMNE